MFFLTGSEEKLFILLKVLRSQEKKKHLYSFYIPLNPPSKGNPNNTFRFENE